MIRLDKKKNLDVKIQENVVLILNDPNIVAFSLHDLCNASVLVKQSFELNYTDPVHHRSRKMDLK